MLNEIAKEISLMDFEEVQNDNTDEAIYLMAKDLYNLSHEDASKVVDIIMEKFVHNL